MNCMLTKRVLAIILTKLSMTCCRVLKLIKSSQLLITSTSQYCQLNLMLLALISRINKKSNRINKKKKHIEKISPRIRLVQEILQTKHSFRHLQKMKIMLFIHHNRIWIEKRLSKY